MSRAKNWCFTLNNFNADDILSLRHEGRTLEDFVYIIFGRETGDSGTRHLQGYISARTRKRLSQLKRYTFGRRAHWEVAKGNPEQNRAYCSKDLDFEEFGELPAGSGSRTDLASIRARIQEGASDVDLADGDFQQWCMYRRAFTDYRNLLNPPSLRPNLRVIVLEGASGVGKTRFCTEYGRRNGGFWISSDPTLRWFDGYQQQPTAIIDDFDGVGVNYRWLLRVLDIYELSVPIKGGFTAWNPSVVFITTNVPIETWFPGVDVSPLRRRVRWERISGLLGRNGRAMTDEEWFSYYDQIANKLDL